MIQSAEQWRELRIARNAIAHEYPDAPDLKVAAQALLTSGQALFLSVTVVQELDSPISGQRRRIGFLAGRISVPDDFNDMGREQISEMFEQ